MITLIYVLAKVSKLCSTSTGNADMQVRGLQLLSCSCTFGIAPTRQIFGTHALLGRECRKAVENWGCGLYHSAWESRGLFWRWSHCVELGTGVCRIGGETGFIWACVYMGPSLGSGGGGLGGGGSLNGGAERSGHTPRKAHAIAWRVGGPPRR